MSQPQETLACAIARHHFGPIVGEVVRQLLFHPHSTVYSLATHVSTVCDAQQARSPSSKGLMLADKVRLVRDALAVLLQHDVARAREKSTPAPKPSSNGTAAAAPSSKAKSPSASRTDDPSRSVFEYSILLENLLCRTRQPLYLGFVRLRYGRLGEVIARVLFERGRMTPRMIFSAALDAELPRIGLSVADAEACLTDMVKSGLLHWGCRRIVPGQPCPRSTVAKKEPLCHAAVGEKSPIVGSKRARPDTVSSDDSDSDADSDDDDGLPRISVGTGDSVRKVRIPTRDNDVDVWTVCYWHLNREFRNECCVMVVRNRLQNDLAARILRAGLQLALEMEDCHFPSEDFETADIPTEAVQKRVEQKGGGSASHEFWDAVQLLLDQTPRYVIPVPDNAPTKLRFVPGRLVADARQKTMSDLIVSRYRSIGHRLFSALAIEGAMEERMLAEKCMLPAKVVREHMYRMYEDRVVMLQEVPRSQEQLRSSNWYFLWMVNILSTLRNVLDVMYTATHNLFVRLESLDLHGGSQEDRKLARAQEKLLMGSILRMDQSIMVMRDFGPLTAAFFPARYRVVDGPVGKVKKKR